VKNPIDLGEIQAKQQRGEYKSIEQFFSDIDLLHSNCVLYCETRYPDLVADASKLRVMAKIISRKTKDADRMAERLVAKFRKPYTC
jgi:hypothetical protein